MLSQCNIYIYLTLIQQVLAACHLCCHASKYTYQVISVWFDDMYLSIYVYVCILP